MIGGDNQGFPNGRRLADDVLDIALQVVEGELVGSPNDLGDGVSENDVEFLDAFPYLALPPVVATRRRTRRRRRRRRTRRRPRASSRT